jgi:hypothetical protein
LHTSPEPQLLSDVHIEPGAPEPCCEPVELELANLPQYPSLQDNPLLQSEFVVQSRFSWVNFVQSAHFSQGLQAVYIQIVPTFPAKADSSE